MDCEKEGTTWIATSTELGEMNCCQPRVRIQPSGYKHVVAHCIIDGSLDGTSIVSLP